MYSSPVCRGLWGEGRDTVGVGSVQGLRISDHAEAGGREWPAVLSSRIQFTVVAQVEAVRGGGEGGPHSFSSTARTASLACSSAHTRFHSSKAQEVSEQNPMRNVHESADSVVCSRAQPSRTRVCREDLYSATVLPVDALHCTALRCIVPYCAVLY